MNDNVYTDFLQRLVQSKDSILKRFVPVDAIKPSVDPSLGNIGKDERLKPIVEIGFQLAREMGLSEVSPSLMFLALLESSPELVSSELNIKVTELPSLASNIRTAIGEQAK